MANQTINLNETLYQYLLDNSLREPDVMSRLRSVTAALPDSMMQVAPEQAQFMQLLIRLMGAKQVLEIGTYTGYSALAMALALPAEGKLTCCDLNKDSMSVGLPFWKEAGVHEKINFMEGPAVKSLNSLLDAGLENSFDFAFIDADKVNYQQYFELCLNLVKQGGLVLIDNTLWGGAVCDENDKTESTIAIREFNQQISRDKRVVLSQLPLADGVTMALLN